MADIDVDAGEAQIDALIERRAQEAEEANLEAFMWAESVRRFDLIAQRARRREWIAYHQDLARLHAQLSEEHREKALQLIDEGGEFVSHEQAIGRFEHPNGGVPFRYG